MTEDEIIYNDILKTICRQVEVKPQEVEYCLTPADIVSEICDSRHRDEVLVLSPEQMADLYLIIRKRLEDVDWRFIVMFVLNEYFTGG